MPLVVGRSLLLVGLALAAGACRRAPEPRPTPVTTQLGPVRPRLAAGAWSTCFVTAERRVKCWGPTNRGLLGNGLEGGITKAAWVEGVDQVEQVAVTDSHACAVAQGKLVCWGDVLGLGARWKPKTYTMATHVRAVTVDSGTSFVILADGTAWYWGHMPGVPTGPPRIVETPQRLPEFDGASQAPHPPGGIVLEGGVVRCPGSALPCVSADPRFGTPTVTKVDSGLFYQWALRADGSLWRASRTETPAWSAERIGVGGRVRDFANSNDRTCLVEDSGVVSCFDHATPTPTRVNGLPPIDQVAAGSAHHCGLSQVGDQVWCWGSNTSGALGDGSTTPHSGPVRAL